MKDVEGLVRGNRCRAGGMVGPPSLTFHPLSKFPGPFLYINNELAQLLRT